MSSTLTLPNNLHFSQEHRGTPVVLGGFCTMSSWAGEGFRSLHFAGGRPGSRNLPLALTPCPRL